MGRHLKEVAEKIIESVERYNVSVETITEVDSITVPLEDVLKMTWSDDMSLEEAIDVIKNKE